MRDDLFLVDPTVSQRPSTPPLPPPAAGQMAADAATASPAAGSGAPGPDAGPPTSAGAGGSMPSGSAPPFRWTETIPGAGACQAAAFMGQFTCTTDNVVGQNKFAGTITLFLKGSSETQLLSVERSQILVYDEDMKLVVSTEMTGILDCNTQQLIAALVPKNSEMMPIERLLNWLNPNATPLMTGMIKGPLDPSLQVIRGDIELVFEPMPKCPGTFSLQGSPKSMP